MTISQKNFLASGIALTFVAAISCGKSGTPTTPGATGTAPAITSLSPSTILPSQGPQTLTVGGANFLTGLTFTLRSPEGVSTSYSSGAISNQTSTSFGVSVVINTSGNWTASVKNVDGQESSGATFTVAGAPSNSPPQILSITPGALFRNASSQSFSINGQNFRSGATVVVTNPSGSEIQSSISSLSETVIVVLATFNTTGTYSVMVRNTDGSTSDRFFLTVNPAAP